MMVYKLCKINKTKKLETVLCLVFRRWLNRKAY